MMEDKELLDAVWNIAFNGLDKAYELKHDLQEVDVSPETQKWAQGKADAFRLILAMMRGHTRFYSRADKGNEESADVPDDVAQTLRDIEKSAANMGVPLLPIIPPIAEPRWESF